MVGFSVTANHAWSVIGPWHPLRDGFERASSSPFVIPAKVAIQVFQSFLDPQPLRNALVEFPNFEDLN